MLMTMSGRHATLSGLLVAMVIGVPGLANAHGVSARDALFVQAIDGPAIVPFLYLGAKHMVTGYDHLLFLVGVIFFLYQLKDIVAVRQPVYARAQRDAARRRARGTFTPTPYIIDAIIGVLGRLQSIREHGRIRSLLGFQPNTRAAVHDLRSRSRLRPGDEAAGVRGVAERPGDQHRQLQRRRRDRPNAWR